MNNRPVLRGGYSSDHLAWLSTLRGFAALLVFISHMTIIPVPGDILFALGRSGVVCFFLMTGFLAITARRKRRWKQYAWNRFLRVYPVYWVLLVLIFIVSFPEHSVKSLLLNLTLFEEFLGEDAILGASWMLPIQVVFFAGVTIVGASFFVNEKRAEKSNINRGCLIMAACMICAIATGAVRLITGKPFPTAFFLLLGISLLGIYYWYVNGEIKKLIGIIAVFEIGFIVAVVLSYPTQVLRYILSYNTGILLFALFEKCVSGTRGVEKVFSELGKIGFTFFLGAGIPWTLLLKISSFERPWWMIIIGCGLKLIFAIALGYVITKYIENPLLKWGKKIEKKLL